MIHWPISKGSKVTPKCPGSGFPPCKLTCKLQAGQQLELTVWMILLKATTAVIKYLQPSNLFLGRKGFIWLRFHATVHGRKSGQKLKQGRNLSQDLMQRAGGMLLTDLLFVVCSACFKEPRASNPEVAPPTMDWTLPHQSLIK